MPPRVAPETIPPNRHPTYPQHQYGVVSVTGTKTVDTGLGHNNFVVYPSVKGGLAAIQAGALVAWDYGTTLGTFVLTVTKFDAAFGPLIADTVAKNISYLILSGSQRNMY